ncbi:MAG: DUF512 domain-containing protein [Actinomycetota bacterium]|nr:DUF512 domain-containing protein [Actinomycetota bacterium]MDD5667313.1 DUF512 domain-containing protein [Actinomycetota bacterium]
MTPLLRHTSPLPGNWKPPEVVKVRQGSPCAGKAQPGDLLLEINGKVPMDIIDYMQASEESSVSLRLAREGKRMTRKIRKDAGVPLGLVFDDPVFDGVRTCRNHCIFCFVDQLPRGLRPSLYVKDDDYRLSFYYGNFITLNNISRDDLDRIRRLRISPLYVSLHSTDIVLRRRMMGGEAGRGLSVLKSLLQEGLEIHLQVVVCPGINDGGELRRTFRDVLETYTAASLGVVPVGLTLPSHAMRHSLTPHDSASARNVIETVVEYQALAMERNGRRTFFAADEFYCLAGREFPPAEEYDDYPQLENGVGMARKFLDEVREAAASATPLAATRRGIVTGQAGAEVIGAALGAAGIEGVEVITARNRLFGPGVTVTALLGGGDIAASLMDEAPTSLELLIPATMLREGRFLDDVTTSRIERDTGYRLIATDVEGHALVRALRGEEETG